MLVRFSVSNFLSFDNKQVFSMNCGKYLKKHPSHISKVGKVQLLKFASIFGANAAGKSNFVSAMMYAKDAIVTGIPPNSAAAYCRISESNKTKPSSFEFEIKIGEKYYAYGVDILIQQMKFVGEWLYEIYPAKDDELLFKRQPESGEYVFGKRFDDLERLKIYADDMKNVTASTFLKELNNNKGDLYDVLPQVLPVREVYIWLNSQLRLCYPDEPISVVPAFIDEKNLETVNSIISSLGLGIKRCKTESVPLEELYKIINPDMFNEFLSEVIKIKKYSKSDESKKQAGGGMISGNGKYFTLKINPETFEPIVEKILFQHEENDIWFEYGEESDGTKRMIQLLELLFAAVSKSNTVFVIDEIDRSLHPNLTRKLIETYLHLAEFCDIQLIITTHETEILTLDMLRRDEIWFVERNSLGASELVSLDRYKERFDKCVDRAYLDGRYGAIPVFEPKPSYLKGV